MPIPTAIWNVQILGDGGKRGDGEHHRRGMREPVSDDDVPVRVASTPREPGHHVAQGERDTDPDGDVGERGTRRKAETAPLEELFHRLVNASGAEDPPAWRSLSSPAPHRVRSSLGEAPHVA